MPLCIMACAMISSASWIAHGPSALTSGGPLLEKAYQDGAGAPNFEGAEHMLGRRRPIDGTLVDPAVLKFTGERLHQKAEVDKQARLARAERSARFTRSDGSRTTMEIHA